MAFVMCRPTQVSCLPIDCRSSARTVVQARLAEVIHELVECVNGLMRMRDRVNAEMNRTAEG